jgi:3-oxoacyl-[acyl-carrier-protein] synthase II
VIKRVVITGLGLVSNIGIGKNEFWNNLINGKRNFTHTNFNGYDKSQYRSQLVALVDSFNFSDFFETFPDVGDIGRTTQFSLVATKLALEDSGLGLNKINHKKSLAEHKTKIPKHRLYTVSKVDTDRVSLILGVACSQYDVLGRSYKNFFEKNGPHAFNDFSVSNVSAAAPTTYVSNVFDVHGVNYVTPCACASSNVAIFNAYKRIALGIDDVVITGGADACVTPDSYGGFDKMGAFATKFMDEPNKAYRPFDKDRSGMIMAEAAGILILESLDHALKRNATIYCEFLGGSETSDANHPFRPDLTGVYIAKAMQRALEMCSLAPNDIDYINAHGSATVLNDWIETKAIKKVFGENTQVPISGTKSMTGHSIGATGSLEAIATSLAIYNSIIPATMNLDSPDVDHGCTLDYVPNEARNCNIRHAISNSFGFGGINSSIVFKKHNGAFE